MQSVAFDSGVLVRKIDNGFLLRWYVDEPVHAVHEYYASELFDVFQKLEQLIKT